MGNVCLSFAWHVLLCMSLVLRTSLVLREVTVHGFVCWFCMPFPCPLARGSKSNFKFVPQIFYDFALVSRTFCRCSFNHLFFAAEILEIASAPPDESVRRRWKRFSPFVATRFGKKRTM